MEKFVALIMVDGSIKGNLDAEAHDDRNLMEDSSTIMRMNILLDMQMLRTNLFPGYVILFT